MSYASGNMSKSGTSKGMVVSRGSYANRSSHLPKKQYKYLWKLTQRDDVINSAWAKLRKGKTNRYEILRIEENYAYYKDKMKEVLYYTRPLSAGGDADKMFTPHYHAPRHIFEHGKDRETYKPDIFEQWYHHIIIAILSPIFMKYFHANTCGSLPGRGGIYGKKIIERIIKRCHPRYFIKGDIRHFFYHTKVRKLLSLLRDLIADEWFLFMVERIYLHYDWLVLGFYPSQWFANYYLSRFDYFIENAGFRHLRYVDDFVIFSSSKRKLHGFLGKLRHFLGHRFRLRLKNNYEVIKFDYHGSGRPIDIMGFVFKKNKTVLRRRILFSTCRLAKRLGHTTIISASQARSLLSRRGWFIHSNTHFSWWYNVTPYVSLTKLKEIVSKNDKRRNSVKVKERIIYYDFMDSRIALPAA